MDPDGYLTNLGDFSVIEDGVPVTPLVNLWNRDYLAVDMFTLQCSLPSCRDQNAPLFY